MIKLYLGPVVQSIVSLTTLLRHHSVKYYPDYIIKYMVIFCWKNVRIFCSAENLLQCKRSFAVQKILTLFQQKNNSGFVICTF